jgi:uncharacterized protein
MIQDLELLVQLQEFDLRIHGLFQSQSSLPKSLWELERSIASAQKAVDAINSQFAANVAEKKSFEDKVAEAKIALDKSQDRLNSIKTNREYDAVHAEIENFKSTIAGADTRTRNLTAESDKLTQLLDTKKADLEKIKTENEPKILELKNQIASIDSSVAALRQQRSTIAAKVPKSLLRTYDHILSRRKNAKVLSFVGKDNGTCSSCFKVLETQLINEIRRGTKLLTCQNCGAIFVWHTEGETPPHVPSVESENTLS